MAILVPLDLVERARTGEPDDIEDLLRAVWPDAYRLARAVLGEDQPAQDAAQEACIILYRTIASLRDANAFRTWFYRIVVHEASQLKRRRARTEPSLQSASHDVDHNTSIDVWRALESLPQPLREVVVLRYFEDLSSREIASALRIPDGTVRFRLMIARQRLRPLLGVGPEHFSHKTDEGQLHAI